MPARGGDSAGQQAAKISRQAAAARTARQAGVGRAKGQKSETALRRDAKAWNAGVVGEERTARQLARLSHDNVTVLHDRLLDPAKKWNLDHLVAATAGVFIVDAKNWRGDITVYRGSLWRHWNGGPKTGRQSAKMDAEVNKVRGMVAKASARLGHPITPVIALAGSRSRQFDDVVNLGGVIVLSVDRLVPWLRALPATIDTVEAAALGGLLNRVFPAATLIPGSETAQAADRLQRMRFRELPPST